MDMLMEFLQLGGDEAQALQAFAAPLSERQEAFGRAMGEAITTLAEPGNALQGLSDDRKRRLQQIQTGHYAELLQQEYPPELQQRMQDLGRAYYRWDISPAWIMLASAVFAQEFEAFAADLSLAQRRPLMGALYKRLRRDEAWQLEGYRLATQSHRNHLERRPLRDGLTGALRACALQEMLPLAMARVRRHGTTLALAVLELDGFAELRESQGQAQAESVLFQLAGRVQRALRKTDVLVRLRGERFALVLEDIHQVSHVRVLLERLQLDLSVPYALSDTVLAQYPVSMGIALYPDDNVQPGTLLAHAQQALQAARVEPGARETFWAFFDPARDLQDGDAQDGKSAS